MRAYAQTATSPTAWQLNQSPQPDAANCRTHRIMHNFTRSKGTAERADEVLRRAWTSVNDAALCSVALRSGLGCVGATAKLDGAGTSGKQTSSAWNCDDGTASQAWRGGNTAQHPAHRQRNLFALPRRWVYLLHCCVLMQVDRTVCHRTRWSANVLSGLGYHLLLQDRGPRAFPAARTSWQPISWTGSSPARGCPC